MNRLSVFLFCSLILPTIGLGLPSPQRPAAGIHQRDDTGNGSPASNYTFPSLTSLSSTTATSLSTPSSTLDGFVQDISTPEELGFPDLTAADFEFVLDELPQILEAEAEAEPALIQRALNWTGNDISGVEGPDTKKKWVDWEMDAWLASYVKNANVWGTNTKLADSKDFLKDFWQSTGEEGQNTCGDLGEAPCFAKEPAKVPDVYAGLNYQTRFRAYIARVAIANWRNGVKNSYTQMAWSVTDSQTDIGTVRKQFTAPGATPPGDIMDVLLPALGAAAVMFPALAPVAALVGGIAAVSKVVNSRDIDSEVVLTSNGTAKMEVPLSVDEKSANPRPFPFQKFNRRDVEYAGAIETAIDLHVLGYRISSLEAERKKTTVQGQITEMVGKKGGDVLDKAAKVATALKALNPSLPKVKPDSWNVFDSQTKQLLDLYPASVENSFEYNKVIWTPGQVGSNDNGAIVAEGMQSILTGGEWFGFKNNPTTITKIKTDMQTFFRKLILNQTMKQQAVYFTRQYFSSSQECNVAKSSQSDYMNSDNAWCVGSGSGAKTWQLRSARKPMIDMGKKRWVMGVDQILVSFDNWVLRRPTEAWKDAYGGGTNTAYQDIDDYQTNSGTFPNLQQPYLDQMKIGMTPKQIFELSDECQTAHGYPFKDPWPSADKFYPGMLMDGRAIIDGKASTEPKCLFAVPIFEYDNAESREWCKANIQSRSLPNFNGQRTMDPNDKPCSSFKEYVTGAEAKICYLDKMWSSESRPGCDNHDMGLYW